LKIKSEPTLSQKNTLCCEKEEQHKNKEILGQKKIQNLKQNYHRRYTEKYSVKREAIWQISILANY